MIELDVLNSEGGGDGRDDSGPTFWRNLVGDGTDDSETDELIEFGPGDSEPPSGASRRQFLQLMGASMAMAGLAGCRRPESKILPYSHKPEEVVPGIPDYYATAMPFRGTLRPVVVKSNEGRPTKVEGNAEHPAGQSGTSGFEQASVLNLYDPDRSRTVRRNGSQAAWSDFVSFCRQLGNEAAERDVAVLIEETSSPTVAAMRRRMEERFPNLQWVEYSTTGDDPVRRGMVQAFGRPVRPRYELGEAEVIVSLDANFLDGRARDFLYNTQAFAQGRRLEDVEDEMSRLYTVESRYSTTGGTSDHRLSLKAGRIPAFAAALAAELGVGAGTDVSWTEKERIHLREMARDLRDAGRNGLVMAGESQPPEVHALAMALNQELGGLGTTVTLFDTGEAEASSQEQVLTDLTESMEAGEVDTLFMLGVNPVYDAPAEINFEEALANVQDTVHLGRLRNETAQAARWHLPRTHYLEKWGDGRAYDGTLSVIQPLIRPLYHDAHSTIEVLNLAATGVDASGHDLVREQWRSRLSGNFEEQWREVLHDGYLEGSEYETISIEVGEVPGIDVPDEKEDDGLELVFRLDPKLLDGRFSNNPWMQELPDPMTKIVWDNVAVMSETTAAELGVGVQRSEGNFYADRVEITLDGESVELPVWIQPGYPDGSVGVSMGYGRTLSTQRESYSTPFWDTDDQTDIYNGGPVAGGIDAGGEPVDVVGDNVAPLRPPGRRVATGAEVSKTGSGYLIATTQEEGSMQGRPIVRWATLEEFKEDPYFVEDDQTPVPELGHGGDGAAHGEEQHGLSAGPGTDAHAAEDMPEDAHKEGNGQQHGGSQAEGAENVEGYREYPMIWQENHPSEQEATKDNPYYENQWGMTIDLNTCTGCNACIVACTSENNVQVVGKDQVSKGRHMYWIRNDRYYVSEEEGDDDPEMLTQTVMCQHCENAPCESVCPVAATVHSPDGTNQMIYNRCIGTRYCQNNCPYKVRRFNFYDWSKTLPVEVQMAQNPDVTVRNRGVMEKCTWCIHRVRKHQRQADNEERDLAANEIETACQEACPTGAITFGDINNPESDVVHERKNPRRYELLSYLNTKPRLSYLGRVRNRNPRLEEALSSDSTEEMEESAAA